jgi:hypothetical protein
LAYFVAINAYLRGFLIVLREKGRAYLIEAGLGDTYFNPFAGGEDGVLGISR